MFMSLNSIVFSVIDTNMNKLMSINLYWVKLVKNCKKIKKKEWMDEKKKERNRKAVDCKYSNCTWK